MTDSDLPPVLREAYGKRHDEEPTSDILLERTVGELRTRRLLPARAHPSRWRYWGAVAAAAVIGFAGGGIVTGYEGDSEIPASNAGDLAVALEEVQRLGSEQVRAIQSLTVAVNSTDAATFRSVQEVLMSVSSAVSSASLGFLANGTTPRQVHDPAVRPGRGDVIWF